MAGTGGGTPSDSASWRDTVTVVTGASSGIGLAVARAVAQRGGRVALVARSAPKLFAVVKELGSARASAFALDVRDHQSVAALPSRVLEHFGRLDVIVNNAGVNHRGSLSERDVAELDQIIGTNLLAPILLTRACLPHLREGSAIVNVASLAGKVPVPDEAVYSASKAGLRAFSRALSFELRPLGIHVASVCPGPVDTAFFGDLSTVPNLVFSQPMSAPAEIAAAVIRAVDDRILELDVPSLSGGLATLGYVAPSVFGHLRPALELIGAWNKRRFVARKARP